MSGISKNLASPCPFDRNSAPNSVNSTPRFFSSIVNNNGLSISFMRFDCSCMKLFSVFCNKTLTPSSLKNLIKARFLGNARCARNKATPASPSSMPYFPSAKRRFASIKYLLTNFFCSSIKPTTSGFKAKYSCVSEPAVTGPEIINGVRASSTKTESTSSTIAK